MRSLGRRIVVTVQTLCPRSLQAPSDYLAVQTNLEESLMSVEVSVCHLDLDFLFWACKIVSLLATASFQHNASEV